MIKTYLDKAGQGKTLLQIVKLLRVTFNLDTKQAANYGRQWMIYRL
jgi:hypothetical protein